MIEVQQINQDELEEIKVNVDEENTKESLKYENVKVISLTLLPKQPNSLQPIHAKKQSTNKSKNKNVKK